MGEEPINSLAESNAFVNSAKFSLENATINEQSAGWWFNKECLRLVPDIGGEYIVPSDIIDLDIDANPKWLVVRGTRLYSTAEAKFVTGTRPYDANVIRLLSFEDCPFHMKRVIKAAAVILFQQSYDGDATKISEAQTEYQQAFLYCKSQHIRAVKANFGTRDIRLAAMTGSRNGLRTPR
jgi:hypothetical protein